MADSSPIEEERQRLLHDARNELTAVLGLLDLAIAGAEDQVTILKSMRESFASYLSIMRKLTDTF